MPASTDERREMAAIMGLIARRAGLALDDDEIEAALAACSEQRHAEDTCAVVALLHRKADEQGVPWEHELGAHS
jgi:hypothetical protein